MSQTTVSRARGSYVERPSSASLADVINIILDKGIVIDAFVRVSLVGIEVITIDARIVIASVDTYLRFAEATNRLDLAQTGGRDLPELFDDLNQSGASGRTKGVIGGVKEALTGSDEKSSGQKSEQRQSRQQSEGERSGSRRSSS
ncbi:gas vesicle protein GvpJ [Cellulosimicrobium cellulans]|uniref:gas vesicle protein GvpJ n=1 Tax=Cellulosimicrobium cellulans TaxID=1710 RepID=UPI0008488C21|nr:gas vesicle protein GvpJ [Cellulosimicrobium cellulans]